MPIPEVGPDELEQALAGGAPLFDVRMHDEYEAGHVAGAVLIPLPEVPERVADFPTGVPVYLICRSGARSMRAAEFLEQFGVDGVNVAGGTLAWVQSGRPVVAGSDPA
jgi:rhodanese-related sulfurtransferase